MGGEITLVCTAQVKTLGIQFITSLFYNCSSQFISCRVLILPSTICLHCRNTSIDQAQRPATTARRVRLQTGRESNTTAAVAAATAATGKRVVTSPSQIRRGTLAVAVVAANTETRIEKRISLLTLLPRHYKVRRLPRHPKSAAR